MILPLYWIGLVNIARKNKNGQSGYKKTLNKEAKELRFKVRALPILLKNNSWNNYLKEVILRMYHKKQY